MAPHRRLLYCALLLPMTTMADDVRSMLIARGLGPDAAPPTSGSVAIGLAPNQVRSLDLTKGAIHVEAWLTLSWVDSRLAWAPSQHGGTRLDSCRSSL